jgi:hypothetical protein
MVAKRTLAHGSPNCVRAFQIPISAVSDPATGVHNPASRNNPAVIASTSGTANRGSARTISAIPATTRNSSRPAPGQPRANVENRRRKLAHPIQCSLITDCEQIPKRWGVSHSFESSVVRLKSRTVYQDVGRASRPAADVHVGLWRQPQSRTWTSGADVDVRPTYCSICETHSTRLR